MLTLPDAIVSLLSPFAPMFQARTWAKVQVLLVGAVLATRKRTVTSALRAMGLSDDTGFARYHHVLNRAVWSPLQLSRVLLLLLVQHLDQGDSPLVFGIDETLERRRGKQIKAKGIYRDAVRSSRSHFVKASGLRWISLMLLTTIPWAHRTWALPVLTALAPSERYCQKLGRTHKRLTDWARQMILQLRRWLPNRPLVLVADSSYAALHLLHFCQSMTRPVTLITRLRLDAALYEPAPPRLPGQMGRPRLKGERLPTLRELLQCPDVGWTTISVAWYDSAIWHGGDRLSNSGLVSHGQATRAHSLGPHSRPPTPVRLPGAAVYRSCDQSGSDHRVVRVALADRGDVSGARAHLGVETQRQWSDRAISRTTPVLLGLFSWVTLAAHLLGGRRLATPDRRLGMSSRPPLSLTRSLWCAVISGLPPGLSACRRRNQICEKSRLPCSTDSWSC